MFSKGSYKGFDKGYCLRVLSFSQRTYDNTVPVLSITRKGWIPYGVDTAPKHAKRKGCYKALHRCGFIFCGQQAHWTSALTAL